MGSVTASAGSINMKRVMLGGLAAAAFQFMVNGVVNGAILGADMKGWALGMGSLIHPLPLSHAMVLWTLMCVLYGSGGVWLYAGIRPRFGAGPKTALLAGLAVWIIAKLATALDLFALGILPGSLVVGQLIGALIAIVGGVFVGAWFYRE